MTVVINGTTGITSVNGSAAAPSVTGADTDTGIVYGTNTLSLATGGTTAVTVDSSQNVGIGTSSPADKLDVARSSGADSSGGLTLTNTSSSGYGSAVSWKHALNGVAGVWGRINVEAATSTSSFMRFYTATGSALTEKMQIDGSGNLLVGGTTAYAPITSYTSTGYAVSYRNTGASAGKYWTTYISSSNTIYIVNTAAAAGVTMADGATSWSSYSDIRLKNITGGFENALDGVLKLEPIKFTWKSDDSNKPCVGISAQSVQQVVPEAVDGLCLPNGEDETEYLAVRYQELVPLLTAAIQELKAELDAAKADIATLKATA